MKITIITVCLNCKDAIENTILSVINQTYSNIEYIVIDGNSTDGTKEVLEKYSGKIDNFISESDDGIYNAMNKAVEISTGDYILFLNCGDRLYNETVLGDLISKSSGEDVLYGDLILKFTDGRKNLRMKQPKKLNRFLFVHRTLNHQATMVKRNIFKVYGDFDEQYLILADFDFFLRVVFKPGVSNLYIPLTISFYDMNGLSGSSKSFRLRQKDRLKIVKKHLPFPLYFVARLRFFLIMRRKNNKVYKRILFSIDKTLHFLGHMKTNSPVRDN